ncbi:MAG TPA: insulinase family protein [Kofleriaceae bacterium]|jgi:zinc protease
MKRLLSLGVCAVLAACGGSKPRTDIAAPPPTGTEAAPPPAPPVDPESARLALWPEVHKGTLPNGLTYYVLHHEKPEKRAMMWLAVKAGSVDEDDDQRGLAHFDEHMAFNGTKSFPKNELINYLQSIGMRFGADLNANTWWQRTIYQLEVPTDKPEFVQKGFQILHDWAGDTTYDPAEVKAESGVVLEEWRLGRGAFRRLFDKSLPVLFKGTRYAVRDTIGLPDILKKADRDALYRFYKDWYRPDQMAVIVVGDVDPATIEKTIQQQFGDLKNPANERKHLAGGVPPAEGTRVSIETDKELPQTIIQIANIVPHRSNASRRDDRRLLVEQIYTTIVNERFAQLQRKQETPFTDASVSIETPDEMRELDWFAREADAKPGKLEDALRALLTETLRVERHGFTQAELDRARTIVMRGYEEAADRAATTNSRVFTEELVRNFLLDELVIGRNAERDLAKEFLPQITVDELNANVKSFGAAENRAIAIWIPDGQPVVSKDRVMQIIGEVEKSDIPAWQDKPIPTTLLPKLPTPGKIVKEKKIDAIGVTEWTLSNGAKVIVKPADFEKDTVLLGATSNGGTATVGDKDFQNARLAAVVAQIGGAGDYDADTLGKILAGKQVNVQLQVGETEETINANASAKDVEAMFQLLYLRITAPRKDPDVFATWKSNTADFLTNQARSPEFLFARDSQAAEYKNNVRRTFPTPDEVSKLDEDKALAFYKDRYGDVSDFTFVIVGEVDMDKLKPMVETYLASLPGKNRHEREKDLGIRKVGGVVKKTFDLGVEPKSSVRVDIHADDTWSRDKERDAYVLAQLLSNRLREVLREDAGGVYGVGANVTIDRSPHQERSVSIQFGCAPERVDELVGLMNGVLDEVVKGQTKDLGSYIDKIKEIYARQRETELRQDRFWLQRLERAYKYGDDPTDIADTTKTIARMTPELIKASAKHFLDRSQVFTAIRLPETSAAAPAKPATPAPAAKPATPAPTK